MQDLLRMKSCCVNPGNLKSRTLNYTDIIESQGKMHSNDHVGYFQTKDLELMFLVFLVLVLMLYYFVSTSRI